VRDETALKPFSCNEQLIQLEQSVKQSLKLFWTCLAEVTRWSVIEQGTDSAVQALSKKLNHQSSFLFH